jgi:hypothetical protein
MSYDEPKILSSQLSHFCLKGADPEHLTQHNQVRALFDNGWLNLFALDEKGHMAWRYTNGLIWEPFQHMNNTMAPTCAIRR